MSQGGSKAELARGALPADAHLQYRPDIDGLRAVAVLANRAVDAASKGMANVTILDPSPFLCDKSCRAVVDGKLIYINWGHVAAQSVLLHHDTLTQQFFSGS